jgi:hypothetical protein
LAFEERRKKEVKTYRRRKAASEQKYGSVEFRGWRV